MSEIRFNRWSHQSGTGGIYQDSSGNIGIGTSTPTSVLDIQGGSIKIGNDLLTSSGVSTFTSGLNVTGGSVGIGTDNPGAYFSDANDIVLQKTDDCGITIASGTSQKGTVAFADGTTGDQAYRGYIQYNHSTDSLQVATTGTERLRITSNGDVGIGTNSVDNLLTIVGDHQGFVNDSDQPQATLLIKHGITGSNRRWIGIGASTTGAWIQSSSPGGSGLAAPLSINPGGGNVGIGTDNPAYPLSIGKDGATAILELKRTNTNTTGAVGSINWTASDGHSVANIYALGDGDNEGAHLVFRTTSAAGESDPYGSNTFERLRITSSGDLCLGSAVGANNDGSGISIYNENYPRISFRNSTTGNGLADGSQLYLVSDDLYITNNENADVIFRSNATERLRIDSSGTLTSYSPNNSTQNIRYRGPDGNWHGYLNQSVDGGTISNIIGCGGAWDASGTSYNCTKDYNGSFPAAGLAIHNQYNSNLYPRFSFLSKAAGSTNTDGAVSEWMTIYNGNVGINRTSPSSRLHIGSGNLQVGDFSTDTYETKLSNNILSFKRNGDSYIDQLGNGLIHFRLGSSNTSVLKLQDSAEAVKVVGETALTGTTGGAKGLTLQTAGGTSCPLYFGSETHSAQKSMYLNGYWIYLRGHQNEGIRFIFSQASGNAPRSDQYEFKYNAAYRPTGNTTWDGFSDRRAKENIQDVTSALDTIGRLRPVTFDWTNDYADRMNMFNLDKTDPRSYMWTSVKENGYDETRKNNNVGFIAQEFEEVFPNDITQTEMQLGDETISDFKTVNFDSLIPMLTKAVQELKSENDSLRARLDAAGL